MTWWKTHEKEQDLHWDPKLSTHKQMSKPGYRLGSKEKHSWLFVEVEQNCWARNRPKETVLTSSWDVFLTLLWIPTNTALEAQLSNTTV